MRNRSLSGPLLLLLIGSLFLWRNLNPEAPVFDLVARYWPFVLIVWGLIRLVEVLLWRRHDWHSSFTGGEVVLVVLICIAGSGMSAAHQHGVHFINGGLDWWGSQYDYGVSAQAPAAGVKRIVFENPRGNVKVTGADTQDVTITGHKLVRAVSRVEADRTNSNTPVEIVPQGDRLLVRTNQDRVPDNQRFSDDLEVTVPRGVAVESRARVGDYDITDIAGDVDLGADRGDVRIAKVGGNVRLDINRSELIHAADVKGTLDVQGRGSDLDLENISGQVTVNGTFSGALDFKNLAKPLQVQGRNTELRVEALPGTISMNLSGFTGENLVGPVRLVTRARDVRLGQFTQSLDLDAELGDIELEPGRVPLPSIEARSGGGSIELVLPEKAAFQLHATAERGDAVNDFGPSIQREMEGRTAVLKGNVGNGPAIHLTANRGSVSVRKAGTAPTPPRPPALPKPPKSTEVDF
jgi:hypothetical protein